MLKLAIGAACLCATIAQAHSSELSGQQISDLVAGTTVEIETPLGTKLQARYARDGKLSGEAPGLAWYLGTASDAGRWWVASDRLCHKWSRWLNSEPHCMRLAKKGRGVRWRSDDGYTGTAMITVPATIRAASAAPPALPVRPKPAVAPETPPAPPSAPEEQRASPDAGASVPPQQEAEAAAVPVPVPVHAFAAPDKSQPPQDPARPRRAAQPTFKVANVRSDDVLNVRRGPSADFGIVGELAPSSRGIAITSVCRLQWCPVQHRSTSGWVNSAYLAPEEPLARSGAD